jgi:hypothetical protein
MRLYVTSDLHLEFGDLDLKNQHNIDVLILGGDICVARDVKKQSVQDFFSRCSDRFPDTILIMGNHEHYGGDFSKTYHVIQDMLDQLSIDNIHLLEKQTKIIGDYTFIGGTLWTDFNNGDHLTMLQTQMAMQDFRGVKHTAKGHAGGIWKFVPEDALLDHRDMVKYIDQEIENRRSRGDRSDRVIVVGHHAPSRLSTHLKYQNQYAMNGAYSSNLDQFILDRPEICLWTHGHTHEDFDYEIGSTRIVCNPRGYIGHEARADDWQPKLIEL